MSISKQNLSVVGQLLRRDFCVLKRNFLSQLGQSLSWSIRTTLVYTVFMVPMGIAKDYAVFYLCGVVGSVAFFRMYYNSYDFLSDLAGDRCIEYELTLPIPAWAVFLRYVMRYGIHSLLLTLPVFPAGALLVFSRVAWGQISLMKFLLIMMSGSFFWGVYALWSAAVVNTGDALSSLWFRVLHTSWVFGCFFFSWQLLYSLYPVCAYLSLCNPVVYVMEGVRNAFLGPAHTMPFFGSVIALLIITGMLLQYTVRKLKRRLDVVT